MDRIKLHSSVVSTQIQGMVLARRWDGGQEFGATPAGNNTDVVLGVMKGNFRPQYRVAHGVLDANGKFQFDKDSVALTPASDIKVIINYDNPATIATFSYDAIAPADANDPTFQLNASLNEVWLHVGHATKKVQVRWKPTLTDAQKAESFDVGLSGDLNVQDSDSQESEVDIYTTGERFATGSFAIGANFSDGYGYALADGTIGDKTGTEVKAVRILTAPSQENPVLVAEVL